MTNTTNVNGTISIPIATTVPGTQTISVEGLMNAFGFTNAANVAVTHFDPDSNSTVTEHFVIGGDFGPTNINIRIGLPDGTLSVGEITVTPTSVNPLPEATVLKDAPLIKTITDVVIKELPVPIQIAISAPDTALNNPAFVVKLGDFKPDYPFGTDPANAPVNGLTPSQLNYDNSAPPTPPTTIDYPPGYGPSPDSPLSTTPGSVNAIGAAEPDPRSGLTTTQFRDMIYGGGYTPNPNIANAGPGNPDTGYTTNPDGSITNPGGTTTYTTGDGTEPILLDLSGHGINITELNRSSTFMDATGSGLSNRTAWAGAGTAVLFFDPNGLNKIIDRNQYIFTQWDPTATSDMQALRDVFDSNGDGVFNASDAKWSQFKLLVTNAQAQLRVRSLRQLKGATQTVETLAQAGITAINLKTDTTNIQYRDGSAITGETSFTFSNGTTGTVASVSLATDAYGHKLVQTTAVNGTTTTITSTGYGIDSVASNDDFARSRYAA